MVPEIAARAHVETLDLVIAEAMVGAKIGFAALDGVAAAAGPGLIGGVIVGLTTAKAIALVAKKPFVAVNHLEAHALTAPREHQAHQGSNRTGADNGVAGHQVARSVGVAQPGFRVIAAAVRTAARRRAAPPQSCCRAARERRG